MPNHYHFLVRQMTERPISDWLKDLFNGYVQAVNKQVGRSGTLFQGRAKHVLVDRDEHLIHLARYIHLNPVKAGLAKRPQNWRFSNYAEWLGARGGTLVDRDFVMAYFSTFEQYIEFVHDHDVGKELAEELERYYLD